MTKTKELNLFHVYKTGRMTVIGFEGRHLENPLHADTVREQLMHMVKHHDCEILVVDLMNLGVVSSWILGVLAAIQQSGTDVELYHPSDEIRQILDITKLNQLLHVRET